MHPFTRWGEPQGTAAPEHAACLTLAADLLQENHWPIHSSLHLICKLLQGKDLFLLLLLLSCFSRVRLCVTP